MSKKVVRITEAQLIKMVENRLNELRFGDLAKRGLEKFSDTLFGKSEGSFADSSEYDIDGYETGGYDVDNNPIEVGDLVTIVDEPGKTYKIKAMDLRDDRDLIVLIDSDGEEYRASQGELRLAR